MFSYAMGSAAVMYPVQFNVGRGGERSAQPCLHHGPRAGTSHMWDATGMLQPLQLCAKRPPALRPG